MATTEAPYVWKCKCGQFKVKILADRPLTEQNCCCRSCVSHLKYMEEKHPGGTSAVAPESGGAAMALFRPTDLDLGEVDPTKLGYLKTGETGVNILSYTKCCNTQFIMSGGNAFAFAFIPLNRFAIYKSSDGTPLKDALKTEPACNNMVKFALDPAKVPDPKCQYVHAKFLYTAVVTGIKKKLGLGKNTDLKAKKIFYAKGNEEDVEVVPPLKFPNE